ncbi:MAG: Xaa-Pro aminopeptidase [Thermoleophilia bacterium]|nr:Xaa-Pro aminopeptidase [Thermoleophilia bacterium]
MCDNVRGMSTTPTTRPSAEQFSSRHWFVPHAELRARVAALQARMVAADIDAAVVYGNADVLYVSGAVIDGVVVVPAAAEPVVLAKRAAERIEVETCWEVRRSVSTKQLAAHLDELGAARGRVAVALDVVPAATYLKLASALPGATFVNLTHDMRSVRAIKSAWELDNIRTAARQVRDAMVTVARQVVPGHTELDGLRLAEGCLRADGHQGIVRMRRFGGEGGFGTVVAGANAALPGPLDAPLGGTGLYPSVGRGASTRELVAGDLLVLDLMGAANGYLSDCTRVIAVGGIDAIDDDLLEAQAWCVGVLEQVAAAARPGVAPSTLYQLALDLAADGGHAERFMGVAPDQARFVGHGIGMEVDEYPFLARGFDEPLQAGMVFALEPKLVFPGRAAVGIEDSFVVGEDGVEALPALPRDVIDMSA